MLFLAAPCIGTAALQCIRSHIHVYHYKRRSAAACAPLRVDPRAQPRVLEGARDVIRDW